MGREINLLDEYPRSKRPIKERAQMVTANHRKIARQFDKEFFDGDRLTGYGGYTYHPRFWTKTVRRIVDYYNLREGARVLDIGCAKGFLMYDMSVYRPDLEIRGVDISEYACKHAKIEVQHLVAAANAKALPFEDNSFDLVLAINTIHNLTLDECKKALTEIMRVSRKNKFVMNDAWRTEAEKQAMLAWNLTALTYMHVKDWKALFSEVNYTGDYFWFLAVSD